MQVNWDMTDANTFAQCTASKKEKDVKFAQYTSLKATITPIVRKGYQYIPYQTSRDYYFINNVVIT